MSQWALATKIVSIINCIYLSLMVLYFLKIWFSGSTVGIQCTPFLFIFLYFVVMDGLIAILITQGHMKSSEMKWRKWLAFLFCVDIVIFFGWFFYLKWNPVSWDEFHDKTKATVVYHPWSKFLSLLIMLAVNGFILGFVVLEEDQDQ